MFLTDDVLVTSASDLTVASQCEFGFLRRLDTLRGRIAKIQAPADALLDRAAALGDAHELRRLDRYRQEHESVVEFERPAQPTLGALAAAAEISATAFRDGASVVFQATMFDHDLSTDVAFVGFADFIVRQPDGRYRVEDTKLARKAKVTAVLQIAAYAEQLAKRGILVDDTASLILGDGTASDHLVDDLLPVYRLRRRRLVELILLRDTEATTAEIDAVQWGDSRFSVCGACEHCTAEITAQRDVLLVANLRRTQRDRLQAAGIRTIDELAASSGPVEGIGAGTLASLRAQAQLQIQAEVGGPPPFRVVDPAVIAALPDPDEGDIFFDFEGDPLYTEGDGTAWGLDYLFGLIETDGTFRAFWAHDFAEEATALREFLAYLITRRAKYPNMRVYHYASYERTHLAQLAIRHGYGEEIVDDLFRNHVLVDLYPVVRGSIRVGSPSYSIKKLEPLYMGDDLRDDDGVTNAGDSIVEYARAAELRGVDDAAFEAGLKSIEDYNAYDCRSTKALRDWLLSLVPDRDPTAPAPQPAAPAVPSEAAAAAAALSDKLVALAGGNTEESDHRAMLLGAAAVGYHAREDKKVWWEHFARLLAPVDEWSDQRGVFIVREVEVERDWFKEGRQRYLRRRLKLVGEAAPGSKLETSDRSNAHLLYDAFSDAPTNGSEDPGARIAREVRIDEVGEGWLVVEHVLKAGEEPFEALPMALTPGSPIATKSQREAIGEWAQHVIDASPEWPQDAASDLLRRQPPRTASGGLPPSDVLDADTLCLALERVDRSYLAVQGPPGTGKTHVGAHTIAELVRRGWRIGVTAQSHAVIGNFLRGVVKAGLDPAVISHVSGAEGEPFGAIKSEDTAGWIAGQPAGLVVGGTSWVFSNASRVARGSLDLLVVDEAGQFALANSIAVSVAAQRLLLLGDPQQLPQVSQGTHPQPIDESALGWIAGGESVLPPEFGYFLPLSRRMDAALTEHVSRLSYCGALRAHDVTTDRRLEGVDPGLHVETIEHTGNAIESAEEAAAVVERIQALIGTPWTDPSEKRVGTPLTASDFIVVTPYNAQRERVVRALNAAGLGDVPVGTVDKFQGKEASIAMLTLAASSSADVPRGMEFLINRNRLNVAISRGKWAAYVFCSPDLVTHLPTSVAGVKELGAFVRLIGADHVQ